MGAQTTSQLALPLPAPAAAVVEVALPERLDERPPAQDGQAACARCGTLSADLTWGGYETPRELGHCDDCYRRAFALVGPQPAWLGEEYPLQLAAIDRWRAQVRAFLLGEPSGTAAGVSHAAG